MRHAALAASISAAVLFLAPGCSSKSSTEAAVDYAELDAFVEATRQAYQVPGAAVGVVRDTGVVFVKGYGVRSIESSAPVDTATRFQLASVSKLLTAVGIGTLVDAGRTTWDQPVKDHYPDLQLADATATAQVSFRHLLSHQAGLREYDGDLLGRLGYDKAEILRRVQYMVIDTDAYGAIPVYSNMGFFIAGEIGAQISDVHALDWQTHLEQALLTPLGMTRSSTRDADLRADDNHVAGHRLVDGVVEPMALEADPLPPAGSIVATADDMARLVQMLLNRGELDGTRILAPETVDELFKTSILNHKVAADGTVSSTGGFLGEPGAGYGLGTENYTFLGTPVVTKNGALDGVRTYVALIPSQGVGIFVLSNLNMTMFPEAVTARFLEAHIGLAGKNLQLSIGTKMQAAWSALGATRTYPADPAPSPVDSASLAGEYTNTIYGDFTVALVDTTLTITSSLPPAYAGVLTHWDGPQFLIEWPDPDDMPGLVELQLSADGTQATGFAAPATMDMDVLNSHNVFVVVDYGPFTRM
jgi:CubicO group peptidase (beta-lactamase class C family)